MTQAVKWLPKPQKHDFQAAEDYLSLLMPLRQAIGYRKQPAAAKDGITHRRAKDILRASQLALLGEDNKHVASDLRKAATGPALSPILLLRGDGTHPPTHPPTRSSSPAASSPPPAPIHPGSMAVALIWPRYAECAADGPAVTGVTAAAAPGARPFMIA